ncbi:hypothetical protein V5799_015855 [Amblyomma americanum]|uniref:Ribokinase n=1 Tax=Amblyomma americanum TaxID=6943 RepID=A0AAQ4F811_AMBAM
MSDPKQTNKQGETKRPDSKPEKHAEVKHTEAVFLGACVVDLISYADRFPVPGETLIGNDFVMGHGGKAANACVMGVRMGLACGMIAKLGSDKIGKDYLQYLHDIKVNTDHVKIADTKANNATANIIVTKKGQNCIVYVPGAASLLLPHDVRDAEPMIKNAKVLVALFECSRQTLVEALQIARKHGVTTYVNAAPYDASMTDEVYKLADIICVNETETSRITGMKIANKAEYQAAANAILAKGCKAVIITLGDQGACFCTSADRQLTYVPAEKVDVEDPTGAGDAFNGAFAYHHVRHPDMPLADRIKKACDIASITVQSPGTQLSYPDRADIPESLL